MSNQTNHLPESYLKGVERERRRIEAEIDHMVKLRKPTEGIKHDQSKPRWSLLPEGAVNQIIEVLEYGARKYDVNNWQRVPDARTRYYDAAMRHLDAWKHGEINDAESGLPHLAHAGCCLMFLMWLDENQNAAVPNENT